MRTILGWVVILGLASAPAAALAQPADEPGQQAQAKPGRPAQKEPAKEPAKEGGEKPAAQVDLVPVSNSSANVQIELTILDQIGTGAAEKKTVSMIVANGQWGKIRATAAAQKNAASMVLGVGLNVDARPFIVANGSIRTELTLAYNPMVMKDSDGAVQARPTELNQSLTVTLQNGKALTVSQAADPISDRKIVVEVKATILK